jgi:CheY-like chemotaxis protein
MTIPCCQVLIVDDDPDIRESLRFFLEDFDYPVMEAPDGPSALRFLCECDEPWVVLLDRMMPKMDGIAVLRALATLPAVTARIAIVFMSARTDPSDADMAHLVATQAFASITKPFDLDALLEIVRQAWRHVASRAQAAPAGQSGPHATGRSALDHVPSLES